MCFRKNKNKIISYIDRISRNEIMMMRSTNLIESIDQAN